MMKGTNSLILNHQTMCEALQVWVDKTLQSGHGVKVTSVSSRENKYPAAEFEVVIVPAVEDKS